MKKKSLKGSEVAETEVKADKKPSKIAEWFKTNKVISKVVSWASARQKGLRVTGIVTAGTLLLAIGVMAWTAMVDGDTFTHNPNRVAVTTHDQENPPDIDDGGDDDRNDGGREVIFLDDEIYDPYGNRISNVVTDEDGVTIIVYPDGSTQRVEQTEPPSTTTAGGGGNTTTPPETTDEKEPRCTNPQITIVLNGDSATFECDCMRCVNIEGSTVKARTPGTYTLTGTLNNAYVEFQASSQKRKGDFNIIFNNVTLTNSSNSNRPPLRIRRAEGSGENEPVTDEKAFITVKDGTTNNINDTRPVKPETLEDQEPNDDPNAAIFSRIPLIIDGGGYLNVSGNFYHGINSREYLMISNTKVKVDATSIGIRSRLFTNITRATLNLTTGGKGIRAAGDNFGSITIVESMVTVSAGRDAVHAAVSLTAQDSNFIIVVDGGHAFGKAEEGISKRGLRSGGELKLTGGYYELDTVQGAVNTSANLIIRNVDSMFIKTLGSGLRGRPDIEISNSNITISACNNGARADGWIKIQGGSFSAHARNVAIDNKTPFREIDIVPQYTRCNPGCSAH